MHIDVPSVETQKLVDSTKSKAQCSKEIQRRVQKARNIQTKRFKAVKIRVVVIIIAIERIPKAITTSSKVKPFLF